MIGMYWLFLSGIVYLAGTAFVSHLVTGPVNADKCMITEKNRSCRSIAFNLAFAIAIISLAANAVHVVLHCSVMTETSLSEVWDILPAFLANTRYGRISLARMILHAMLAVITGISLIKDNRIISYSCLLLTSSILITLALSGHQGSKGFGSINLYLDIIHLLAISVWIGGLLYIRCGYSYVLKCIDEKYQDEYLSIINRFSALATVSVSIVMITGIWMMFAFPQSTMKILTTNFGIALSIKIILIAIIAGIGGVNKFILIPRINSSATADPVAADKAQAAFHKAVTAESLIGLSALLATAVLTHLSPMD
jgi:putative copper export protein